MCGILYLLGIVKVANPLNMGGIKTKREEGVTDYRRNKAMGQNPEWPERPLTRQDKTRYEKETPDQRSSLARQSKRVPKCLILSSVGTLKEGKVHVLG